VIFVGRLYIDEWAHFQCSRFLGALNKAYLLLDCFNEV